VYVQLFPSTGGKWKVSIAGGKFPAWSRTTRELFFLGGDDRSQTLRQLSLPGSAPVSNIPPRRD
jgi:hypothetical protein